MQISFKWSLTLLLIAATLTLPSCGGGGSGGGGSSSGGGSIVSSCANNTDTFICEVYKVVNNLTSETEDPIPTDPIVATSPDDTDPTTKI